MADSQHTRDLFFSLLLFARSEGPFTATIAPSEIAPYVEKFHRDELPKWQKCRLAELISRLLDPGPVDARVAAKAVEVAQKVYRTQPSLADHCRRVLAAAGVGALDAAELRSLVRQDQELDTEISAHLASHLGRLAGAAVMIASAGAEDRTGAAERVAEALTALDVAQRACDTLRQSLVDGTALEALQGRVGATLDDALKWMHRSTGLTAQAAIEGLYELFVTDAVTGALLRHDDLCETIFARLSQWRRRERLRRLIYLPSEPVVADTWPDLTPDQLLELRPFPFSAEPSSIRPTPHEVASFHRALEALVARSAVPTVPALVVVEEYGRTRGEIVRLSADIIESPEPADVLQVDWPTLDPSRLSADTVESCANACAWLSARLRQELSEYWEANENRRTVRLTFGALQGLVASRGLSGGSLGVATALSILAELLDLDVGRDRLGDVAVTGDVKEDGSVGRVDERSIEAKLEAVRRWNRRCFASERITHVIVPAANDADARAVIGGWGDENPIHPVPVTNLDEVIDFALGDPWQGSRDALASSSAALSGSSPSPQGPRDGSMSPTSYLMSRIGEIASATRAGRGARTVAFAPWSWEPTGSITASQSPTKQLAEILAARIAAEHRPALPLHEHIREARDAPLPIVVDATDASPLTTLIQNAVARIAPSGGNPSPNPVVPEPRISLGLRAGRFVFVVSGLGLDPDGSFSSPGFFAAGGALTELEHQYPTCNVIALTAEGFWPRSPDRDEAPWLIARLTSGRSTLLDAHLASMTGDYERQLQRHEVENHARTAAQPGAAKYILACQDHRRPTSEQWTARASPRSFLLGTSGVRRLPLHIVPSASRARSDAEPTTLLTELTRDTSAAGRGGPRRLLLFGGSGAGKTTELLYLLFVLASHHGDDREGGAAPIPLFCTMADLVREHGGRAFSPSSLASSLAVWLAKTYGYSEAIARRCLGSTPGIVLLLDGLDKGLEEHAAHAAAASARPGGLLEIFRGLHAPPLDRAHCVVTSRRLLYADWNLASDANIRATFDVFDVDERWTEQERKQALDYLSAVADPTWPANVETSGVADDRRPLAVRRLLDRLGVHHERVIGKRMVLYMLSEVLADLAAEPADGKALTLAGIYDRVMDNWMRIDFDSGGNQEVHEPTTYRGLLQLLASGMYQGGRTRLSVDEAVDVLAGYVQSQIRPGDGRESDLPGWWPRERVQGLSRGETRWLGTRLVRGRLQVDRDDLRRMVATLARGTLLRIS